MKKYYSYQSFWIGPPPFFFPIFQLSTIFHLNDSKVFFYLIELLIQIQNLRIIKLLLQVTSFLNCKGIWLHAEFVTNHMKVAIGHGKISGISQLTLLGRGGLNQPELFSMKKVV